MKKIGFVSPWYGETIPGGAEMEMRGLVKHFSEAGMQVEVLTTCVKEFASDWNVNYYKPGEEKIGGVIVRRFKVRKRNTEIFDSINAKLMQHKHISSEDGEKFLQEMVNSTDLYRYMEEHQDEYSVFLFIPYMFGTTYYGVQVCPEKSVLVPCFHDEAYIYIEQFKKAFEKVGGISYLSQPECDLANRVFDLKNVEQRVTGAGVDTDMEYKAERFRDKFGIEDPFILYAGRKDVGKNIYTLIKYLEVYRQRYKDSRLKLIMIGGGDVIIPEEMKEEIIDLGYVDKQDKYDACAAALALCQPSKNESFSIVIMESWLCERPVLVSGKCAVTRNFVSESNAGLYFESYGEFEGAVNYLIEHEEVANQMGLLGREYVVKRFAWDVVVNNYKELFDTITKEQ